MAKRFTDTDKWKRPWFRKLSVHAKLTWGYVLDQCEFFGVWAADFELLSFQIGIKVTKEKFADWFDGKFIVHEEDKYFIPSFIEFQYGELGTDSSVHRSVIAELERIGISVDYRTGLATTSGAIAKRLSGKYKAQLIAEDGFKCTYCGIAGDEKTLCIDHILPKAKGGDNDPGNLTTSCVSCNSRKIDLPAEIFIKRLGEQACVSEKLKLKLNTLIKKLNTLSEFLKTPKDKDKEEDKDKEREQDKEGKGATSGIPDFTPALVGAVIDNILANKHAAEIERAAR